MFFFYSIQVRYRSFTSLSFDILHQFLARFYVTQTYSVSLFVAYNNYQYIIARNYNFTLYFHLKSKQLLYLHQARPLNSCSLREDLSFHYLLASVYELHCCVVCSQAYRVACLYKLLLVYIRWSKSQATHTCKACSVSHEKKGIVIRVYI
jgi:hypothetical protein